MHKAAIILAGGAGTRAGGSVPKQFRLLCGRPVVWWSMKAFHDEDPDTQIVLVVHPGYFDDWEILMSELPEEERMPHTLCCGGKDRVSSVANGLLMLKEVLAGGVKDCRIAVHDGARPLLSSAMIERGWQAAEEGRCGVPAVPCVNSLRRLVRDGDGADSGASVSVVRADYVEVQTPQIFLYEDAMRTIGNPPEGTFTDDASIAEACGMSVRLYAGEPSNIKITNPEDFKIAEALLRR